MVDILPACTGGVNGFGVSDEAEVADGQHSNTLIELPLISISITEGVQLLDIPHLKARLLSDPSAKSEVKRAVDAWIENTAWKRESSLTIRHYQHAGGILLHCKDDGVESNIYGTSGRCWAHGFTASGDANIARRMVYRIAAPLRDAEPAGGMGRQVRRAALHRIYGCTSTPRPTGRFAPVTRGTLVGTPRSRSCASTAKQMASFASGSMAKSAVEVTRALGNND